MAGGAEAEHVVGGVRSVVGAAKGLDVGSLAVGPAGQDHRQAADLAGSLVPLGVPSALPSLARTGGNLSGQESPGKALGAQPLVGGHDCAWDILLDGQTPGREHEHSL